MEENFDKIRKEGRLLYEYVRGSTAHHTNLPTSDVDTGGVYVSDINDLFGIHKNYVPQVEDDRNDNIWYELGRFMELLCKSNPTTLEALFIPDECVIYEHPIITEIKKHRDMFITKGCFPAFTGYACEQISKAQGLNKKCMEEPPVYKEPIEFCYTMKGQGTTPILDFLSERGMKQKYCGLVKLPNMNQNYGVYYDFGKQIADEELTADNLAEKNLGLYKYIVFKTKHAAKSIIQEWMDECHPLGYRGMVSEKGESYGLRVQDVPKNAVPICFMQYSLDGYKTNCRKLKEYKEWEEKRNPQRYLDNVENGRGYDCKNMGHCFRLLHMGMEIAETGKVNVDRSGIDRDYLIEVRTRKYTYEELIEQVKAEKEKFDEIKETSTIPDAVDVDKVNELLIELRKKYYGC